MKRFLAIVLVLVLAVSLMPASVFASDGIYVSVGDKEFTGIDQTISVGGGKATLTHVSQMSFKLTLENVNLTSFSKIGTDSGVTYYAGIYYVSSCGGEGSLAVELKGNNRIIAPEHGSSKVYEGVYSNSAMSFKGDNLTVSGVDIGFDAINNFGETSNPQSSRLYFGANNVTVNASNAAVLGEDVSFGNGNCNFCSTGSCCMEAIRRVMGYGGNVSLNFTPDVSNGYISAAALICHEWCRLENTNLSVNVNYDASGYKGAEEITAFGIYSDNNDITGLGNSKILVNVKLIGGGNCSAVGICCSGVQAYASNGTCSELYSKLSLSGKHLDSSAILATGGMLVEGIGEAAVYGASANDCAVDCFGRSIDLNAKSFYAYTDCTAPNYSVIYYEGGNEDDCNKYLTYPENAEFKAVSDDGQVYAVVSSDGKLLNQAVFCNGAYPFRDIDNTNTAPYKDAILWAVNNGITNGFTPVEFRPNADCTRGQVVTFLWRAKGCPEPTITENPFVDVTSTSPFYKAILWAYENGITTGFDETHFKPSNPCTRAQVVTFLWRSEGKPAPESEENPFVDVSSTGSTAPYYTAILWAAEQGITSGYGNNDFRPNVTCTRAQIVTFIYRDVRQPQIAARGNIADIALEVNPESSADKTVSIGGYLFKEADKGVTWDYFPVNVTVTYENGSTDTVTAMLPRMNSTEAPAVNVLGHYGDRVVISYADGVTELFTAVIIDTESVKAMTPTKEGLTLQGDVGLSGQYVTIYGGGYFHIFDMGDGGVFRVRIGSGSDTPNGDVDVFAIVDHYVFFADYGYRTKFNVETQTYDPVCVAARVYRADLDQNANKSTQIANIDNAVSFMLDETGYTVQYYTDNTCTEVGETVHYDFIFPN